ncbi:hypothetical protein EAH80_10210 [Mycobacterium hodleri]|uniref:Uncharacterized protein n=1 Tax=Mycolicibacterium hodleri TaxID=49897 RepID=A0A502EDT9_9MYCO|nr:hypothetical protein EAH80_10210 [Mycolicibacterium hodleri]
MAVRGMTALLALLLGVTLLSLFGGVPMPGLTSPVRLPAGESSRAHDDVDITNPDSAPQGTSIDAALLGGPASPPSSQSASPQLPAAVELHSTGAASVPAFMAQTATGAPAASSPISPVGDSTSETSPTPTGTPTPDPVLTNGGSTSGSNGTPRGRTPGGLPTPANRPLQPPGLSGNPGPGTEHRPVSNPGSQHGNANGRGPKS